MNKQKIKYFIMISLILCFSLLAVGCTNDTTESNGQQTYEVIDSQNRTISFSQVPERVISLAPTVTEILFAIDAQETLVGRTDWCNYPEEVSDYPSVGNIDTPNVELIIQAKPDVVFMSEMTKQEIAQQLENAGITYFVVKNEESIEGAYQSIQMVSEVLDRNDEGQAIVDEMKNDIQAVLDVIEQADHTPTVYYVMGFGESGNFTAGKGTFISEMIQLAGGINVADDTEGWSYSLEKLIEHNPDVLICSAYSPPEEVKQAEGYKTLDAVKNDRMVVINDDMLHRLGPRLSIAFKEMAKALHPDLF